MNIRPMTIADVPNLKLDAGWMYDRYVSYLENRTGPAWAIEDEKGLLCTFGAAFLWDGVCEAWFNLVRKEKTIAMVRIIKRKMAEQVAELGIRRMHATARCMSRESYVFLEKLGFKLEGLMEKYNPDGSDAFLYARVI